MKIINEVQLDYDDVLILPQRSTLNSRKEVILEREFLFYHSPRVWKGIPICASNMSFVGKDVTTVMHDYNMVTVLPKFITVDKICDIFSFCSYSKVWVSIGFSDVEIQRLREITNNIGLSPNIVIDVPNGYIGSFPKFCQKIRNEFPESIITAGNVCTSDMAKELILNGVDIVKIGIGGGCFIAGTKVNTMKGAIAIEKIELGDLVLTHNGNYQKVVQLHSRIENTRIIDINGIKCTSNHEFYVIHNNDLNKVNIDNYQLYAKWVKAEDLSDDFNLIKLTE